MLAVRGNSKAITTTGVNHWGAAEWTCVEAASDLGETSHDHMAILLDLEGGWPPSLYAAVLLCELG